MLKETGQTFEHMHNTASVIANPMGNIGETAKVLGANHEKLNNSIQESIHRETVKFNEEIGKNHRETIAAHKQLMEDKFKKNENEAKYKKIKNEKSKMKNRE